MNREIVIGTRRKMKALALAAAVICTAAGCGSGSKPSSTSPAGSANSGSTSTATASATSTSTATANSPAAWPDACKLVTASDVTAALGTAPTAPPKTDTPLECDYSTPTMYNYVSVRVQNVPLPSFFVQSADSAGATVAVTGLGDAAFKSPPTGTGCTMLVRKGNESLRIDYFVAPTAPHCADVMQLARTALGRTPSSSTPRPRQHDSSRRGSAERRRVLEPDGDDRRQARRHPRVRRKARAASAKPAPRKRTALCHNSPVDDSAAGIECVRILGSVRATTHRGTPIELPSRESTAARRTPRVARPQRRPGRVARRRHGRVAGRTPQAGRPAPVRPRARRHPHDEHRLPPQRRGGRAPVVPRGGRVEGRPGSPRRARSGAGRLDRTGARRVPRRVLGRRRSRPAHRGARRRV